MKLTLIGRGEGKKAKRNENIEMKIISKVDIECRVQPEKLMGGRENNPEY